MNWYQENRWLGNFLLACAAALVLAIWFLFHARGDFAAALVEFNNAATERSRLEHLNPFPNEENFRKTQAALDDYGTNLNKLKEELRGQVLPATPMAPNEFQTRLRQAIANTTERARANRVKLPENFYLGFDEFAASLPSSTDAPLLGQQLQQSELLIGILIDAKADAITNLKRRAAPPETAAATTPRTSNASNANPAVIERSTVDLIFAASPSALRKVLNQIASSERQFFIVRNLYVRNEQLKGPAREGMAPSAATAATMAPNTLKFIVGNEHVEATAAIELVRFTF